MDYLPESVTRSSWSRRSFSCYFSLCLSSSLCLHRRPSWLTWQTLQSAQCSRCSRLPVCCSQSASSLTPSMRDEYSSWCSSSPRGYLVRGTRARGSASPLMPATSAPPISCPPQPTVYSAVRVSPGVALPQTQILSRLLGLRLLIRHNRRLRAALDPPYAIRRGSHVGLCSARSDYLIHGCYRAPFTCCPLAGQVPARSCSPVTESWLTSSGGFWVMKCPHFPSASIASTSTVSPLSVSDQSCTSLLSRACKGSLASTTLAQTGWLDTSSLPVPKSTP